MGVVQLTRLELLIDRMIRQRLATMRQRIVAVFFVFVLWTTILVGVFTHQIANEGRQSRTNLCLSIEAIKAQRRETILRGRLQLRTNEDYRRIIGPRLLKLAETEYARQLAENAPDPTDCKDPQPPPRVPKRNPASTLPTP